MLYSNIWTHMHHTFPLILHAMCMTWMSRVIAPLRPFAALRTCATSSRPFLHGLVLHHTVPLNGRMFIDNSALALIAFTRSIPNKHVHHAHLILTMHVPFVDRSTIKLTHAMLHIAMILGVYYVVIWLVWTYPYCQSRPVPTLSLLVLSSRGSES